MFQECPNLYVDYGNMIHFAEILMLQMLQNLIRNKVLKCCFGSFCFKKSFISKLKNITNVASVRIANLTRLRIAMTLPMQSKARGFIALISGIFDTMKS